MLGVTPLVTAFLRYTFSTAHENHIVTYLLDITPKHTDGFTLCQRKDFPLRRHNYRNNAAIFEVNLNIGNEAKPSSVAYIYHLFVFKLTKTANTQKTHLCQNLCDRSEIYSVKLP